MAEVVGRCELASDRCGWAELLAPGFDELAGAREALSLGRGWAWQWTTRWKSGGGPVTCPAGELAAMPVRGAQPVRRFSWRTSQRRPLTDPLGLQRVLLAAAGDGPVRFGELVEHGGVLAAARAQALHLIWDRRLGVDLAVPLGDRSLVHAGRGPS